MGQPPVTARGSQVDQSPPSPGTLTGGSVENMDDIGASSGASRLDGVRVLIVDDDDSIRIPVRIVLEHHHACDTAWVFGVA
jgi:hypothetical protein